MPNVIKILLSQKLAQVDLEKLPVRSSWKHGRQYKR